MAKHLSLKNKITLLAYSFEVEKEVQKELKKWATKSGLRATIVQTNGRKESRLSI